MPPSGKCSRQECELRLSAASVSAMSLAQQEHLTSTIPMPWQAQNTILSGEAPKFWSRYGRAAWLTYITLEHPSHASSPTQLRHFKSEIDGWCGFVRTTAWSLDAVTLPAWYLNHILGDWVRVMSSKWSCIAGMTSSLNCCASSRSCVKFNWRWAGSYKVCNDLGRWSIDCTNFPSWGATTDRIFGFFEQWNSSA